MVRITGFVAVFAWLSMASAHAVILSAQGEPGSPTSVGFQVKPNLTRNCTGINPCQQDTTIIRDEEILSNTVNECGRTELTGNIDVGENTETALSNNAVTQVKSGGQITLVIHQVNADGAGPFECDMDLTGNSNGVSGQTKLEMVTNVPGANGFSAAKAQDFNVIVQLPSNMTCTGASTGDVCTIRCRNTAVAGPFGGCFAVQQTDVTPKVNTPQNIATNQALEISLSQVTANQKDLPIALAAVAAEGSEAALAGSAAAAAILNDKVAGPLRRGMRWPRRIVGPDLAFADKGN